MIDPTLGFGKVIIDSLVWFLNDLLGALFGALFRLLGQLFNGLISAVFKGFSRTFDLIADVWNRICEGWTMFWDYTHKTWEIYAFVVDCLHWGVEFCKSAYQFGKDFFQWLIGQNEEFGDWLWERMQETLTWLGDFFVGLWERAQNFVFDNGIWLYEWLIGNLDRMIGYFINLIHTIFDVIDLKVQLPEGVWGAIPTFIQWGMFFDSFVPVREIFQLLGIYLIFVVMFSMVRFVRSLIPFVH